MLAFGISSGASAEVVTLHEAKGPIRVDGHLEDWPQARMFVLDQASQLVYGKAYWKGPEDLSGRIFLTYNDKCLYLSALVRKREKVVNDQPLPSLWDADCLELRFSTKGEGLVRSPGDFHLGFTPGTDCKDPRMYCFNKDREIRGGQIVAKATREGYLLEVSVPLDLFSGLRVGPGRSARLSLALGGGGVSGRRIFHFDLAEQADAGDRPDLWTGFQWLGTSEVQVPEAGVPGISPGALEDGVRGSTFAGVRDLKGRVVDQDGLPLAGARVTTWPRTAEARTDEKGDFELPKVKVYDRTVIYAWAPGHGTGLSSLRPGIPLQLKCWRLFPGGTAPGVFGEVLSEHSWSQGAAEPLGGLPKTFQRIGRTTGKREGSLLELGKAVAASKANGFEPLVEVPLDRNLARETVQHLNFSNKAGVRYWVLGNSPDAHGPAEGPGEGERITALINGYRGCFNAMKGVDPSIVLLGPELSEKYRGGGGDWWTPFLTFNGDILDIVSIHRTGIRKEEEASQRAYEDSLRQEKSLLRGLRGRVLETTGKDVPLAASWVRARESGQDLAKNGPLEGFIPYLWMAEQAATAFQEGVALELFDPPSEGKDPRKVLLSLLSLLNDLKGHPLESRLTSKLPALSSYPFLEEGAQGVILLLVNREDRVRRIRVSLDGKSGDLRIEAGLRREFDYESPAHSVSLLRLKAGGSAGEASFFSKGLADQGRGHSKVEFKTW